MAKAILKGKVKRHQEICKEMNTLYEQKNTKYNDSFGTTYEEYGPTALLLRLDDKISRAKALIRNPGFDPGDESIRDTLIDLANYSIMGIIEMEVEGSTPDETTKEEVSNHSEVSTGDENTGDEPQGIEAELNEYTKGELVKIGKELELKLNKKSSKEDLLKAILESPEDKITAAIDTLFSGDDDGEEEQA